MKLNNYQKILGTWGIIITIGYIASWPLLSQPMYLLVLWATVAIIGLGVQVWLGFARDIKSIIIQLVWVGIVLLGLVLTYAELRLGIKLGLHGMASGWFFLVSSGMLITSIIYKFNLSYILLCILYAGVGVGIAFGGLDLQVEIYVAAAAFFVLCMLDAFLEKTKLRTGLTEPVGTANSTK